jgi:hypothetical protein
MGSEEESPSREQQQKMRAGVRLPGFVNDADIGLGDVVKRVTRAAGLRPCRGCERRAATLNRWLVFAGNGGSGRR